MREKRGWRRDAGDLAQLVAHRGENGFVGFVEDRRILHAAQEAPRHDLALGHAVRKLRAHPGAGHQAAALLLGNQEAEAVGRAARNPRRRNPAPRSSRSCKARRRAAPRAARPRRPAAARRCAPRRPSPGGRPPASRRRRGCGTRRRCARWLRRALPHLHLAADGRGHGVHHLPQPAFQGAEQRRRRAVRGCAALARSASTPRVRLP